MTEKQPCAIEVNQVWKLFRRQKQRTMKEMLPALFSGGKKSVIDTFWALRDVNLAIKPGETFGIIGPNGSGKSTLLKLIAGVTQPTRGKIIINGSIAPLIELGAGFHMEMTGRENIFLNAAILGMTRAEVLPLVDDIIDFSEIREFIDTPVKRYSSGMYMRLAFSVATHVNFDILLVDEILSVGDIKFQKKCFDLMEKFKQQGKTIVYVGHNLSKVKSFCDRVAYLSYGELKMVGQAAAVTEAYQATLNQNEQKRA